MLDLLFYHNISKTENNSTLFCNGTILNFRIFSKKYCSSAHNSCTGIHTGLFKGEC